MRKLVLIIAASLSLGVYAQENLNTAGKMLNSEERLTIGGYAQIDYNQEFGADNRMNGKMDIHRLVLLFGYKFNEKTTFISEIEYEHVKEVYVEQAFVNYQFNPAFNLRAGLLLIPMGIINEYHEPTTFLGVERPELDSRVSPTTWREMGAGFAGNITDLSLKYQAYIVNGFNSFDGGGKLRGKDAFRKGRQKGAESIFTSPNLSAKVDYYGIQGLNLGLSGYFGKTQTSAYNNLDESNDAAVKVADSTRVGISMVGIDAKYNIGALQLRGQYYLAGISNTKEYNEKTGKDLGKQLTGYYVEAGYNVLSGSEKFKSELIPFVRFSDMNTHAKVASGETKNKAYELSVLTAGLAWKPASGVSFKADVQFYKDGNDDKKKMLNLGVGVWF